MPPRSIYEMNDPSCNIIQSIVIEPAWQDADFYFIEWVRDAAFNRRIYLIESYESSVRIGHSNSPDLLCLQFSLMNSDQR